MPDGTCLRGLKKERTGGDGRGRSRNRTGSLGYRSDSFTRGDWFAQWVKLRVFCLKLKGT